MRQFSSIPLKLACAGLALAASACAGPPGPPIVLHPVGVALSRPRVQRPEPCETRAQVRLTDAQKASLLQEFDAWQQDRRSAGVPAEAALPPPGPVPKTTATANRACRVSSP